MSEARQPAYSGSAACMGSATPLGCSHGLHGGVDCSFLVQPNQVSSLSVFLDVAEELNSFRFIARFAWRRRPGRLEQRAPTVPTRFQSPVQCAVEWRPHEKTLLSA